MLRTEQVHVVRHKALMKGQSQRRVARGMGLSRNTVKKYLGVSERKRIEVRPRSKSVLDRIKPRMDQLDQEARRKVDAAGKSVLERFNSSLRSD